jgi:hypothetical protein
MLLPSGARASCRPLIFYNLKKDSSCDTIPYKLLLPSGPAAVLVSPLEQQQLTGKQTSVLNSSSSVTLFKTKNGFRIHVNVS